MPASENSKLSLIDRNPTAFFAALTPFVIAGVRLFVRALSLSAGAAADLKDFFLAGLVVLAFFFVGSKVTATKALEAYAADVDREAEAKANAEPQRVGTAYVEVVPKKANPRRAPTPRKGPRVSPPPKAGP